MSLESDLNRALRRGHKAAHAGGHSLSVWHASPVERTTYSALCCNRGCGAVVGVTSTMDVIGDAAWTRCQGDDMYANQLDAQSAEVAG